MFTPVFMAPAVTRLALALACALLLLLWLAVWWAVALP